MPRNLDVAALRSLIAVIEFGGVTRAAERLNLTQSAVSMQIKRLEEAFGVSLLRRVGRGVAVTAEGEQAADYARRILALNDELWTRMTAPGYEGALAVGVATDLVQPHMPGFLRSFDRDFPRVRIKLVAAFTRELQRMMGRGEIDLAFTTEHADEAGGEPIAPLELTWRGAVGGRAWTETPLRFVSCASCIFREHAVAALNEAGVAWEPGPPSEQENVTVASVMADLAVAVFPRAAYAGYLEVLPAGGHLPALPPFVVSAYVGSGENVALAENLLAYVRDAYGAAALIQA